MALSSTFCNSPNGIWDIEIYSPDSIIAIKAVVVFRDSAIKAVYTTYISFNGFQHGLQVFCNGGVMA